MGRVNAVTEGNALYRTMLGDLKKKDMERLEGSECLFYVGREKFFHNTPYSEVGEYCSKKVRGLMSAVEKESKERKVSVVMPVYNRSELAIRALRSVDAQTHENIEVIIIDDGSSEDISPLTEYARNRDNVKIISLKNNCGPAGARNRGIKEAAGDFVAFLDSDDEWAPEKITKQVNVMVATKAKISHTSYLRKDESGKENVVSSGLTSGHVQLQLMSSCPIAMPTVMLTRECIEIYPMLFPASISIGEDVCYWLQILKTEYLVGINDVLATVHTNSKSSAYEPEKQILGLKNIITFLLTDEYYKKHDPELANIMRDYSYLVTKTNKTITDGRLRGMTGGYYYVRRGLSVLRHEGLFALLVKARNKVTKKAEA